MLVILQTLTISYLCPTTLMNSKRYWLQDSSTATLMIGYLSAFGSLEQNLREDLFTAVTTEKVTEEVRQFNSNGTRHQATTTEIITRNNAVALNKSLKDMLESNEVGDSVRISLRGEIFRFPRMGKFQM